MTAPWELLHAISSESSEQAPPRSQLLEDRFSDLLAVQAQKEIVRYKRKDGLDLNATLYLPPGYERERDGRLPCLLWAYPREYKSRVR